MMQGKHLNKLIIALLSVLFIITFIIGYQVGEMRSEPLEISDTVTVNDTVWNTDSFEVVKPIPKIVKVVKRDTVYTEKGDTIQLTTENKTYKDTICVQNDTAIVTSNIQGINAELLSTEVMLKKQEIIKTNTITITKYIEKPKKLFNIQPQATFGYDALNRNWGAVIGIGVGINI